MTIEFDQVKEAIHQYLDKKISKEVFKTSIIEYLRQGKPSDRRERRIKKYIAKLQQKQYEEIANSFER